MVTDQQNNSEENHNSFINIFIKFFTDLFSIREGTDRIKTIEFIQKDIEFKGRGIWILIASVFIASLGLNINSTAVVIGAMLISPLMGPILGLGLSVGTNDWTTLKKSLKFFFISVIVSVSASAIYFLISPLKEASSELLARTQPTLLDVFIGIFGGMAGIIALSGDEKSNVIPGVAIATALMPPLCTAGYGLATWQLNFLTGALYLFFINSVFISLTTFIAVKYLRFPKMNYVNPKREKRIKFYIFILIIIIIIPSAQIFWNVIKESQFNHRAETFIKENLKPYNEDIIYTQKSYSDTLSTIQIYLTHFCIPNSEIKDLRDKLELYGLSKSGSAVRVTDSTALIFHQERNNLDTLVTKIDNMQKTLPEKLRIGVLEEIYKNQENAISGKNAKIEFLENRLIQIKQDTIPLYSLKKELAVQYPEIDKFAFAKSIELNDSLKYDTIPTILVKWKKGTYNSYIRKKSKTLAKWLKIRLNFDSIRVVKY
ncbi:MAG: DUF389 domain-containing protein [Chlorobi bacterium]|nr:DUF389 domain-containing protein [Chlorobiota bacterium]